MSAEEQPNASKNTELTNSLDRSHPISSSTKAGAIEGYDRHSPFDSIITSEATRPSTSQQRLLAKDRRKFSVDQILTGSPAVGDCDTLSPISCGTLGASDPGAIAGHTGDDSLDTLPEIELVSLLPGGEGGAPLPRYRLRADYCTRHVGYSHQDWARLSASDSPSSPPEQRADEERHRSRTGFWVRPPPSLSGGDTDLDETPLTKEQIDRTLDYFVLCGLRVSQMTKTYDDIDAVTQLLEEKERDLELAAKIGKSLLEKNKDLEHRLEEADTLLTRANDKVKQLSHDLSLKDDLLHMYSNSDASPPPSPTGSPYYRSDSHNSYAYSGYSGSFNLSSVNTDVLQHKIKKLEEENVLLRQETLLVSERTSTYEEKEQGLVKDCVRQLMEANSHIKDLSDDLNKKSDQYIRQQEEITGHLARNIELENKMKIQSMESDSMSTRLREAQSAQKSLTTELGDLRDKYDEVLTLLNEAQDELRVLRKKQRKASIYPMMNYYNPLQQQSGHYPGLYGPPPGQAFDPSGGRMSYCSGNDLSLATELQNSIHKDNGQMRLNPSVRVMDQARSVTQNTSSSTVGSTLPSANSTPSRHPPSATHQYPPITAQLDDFSVSGDGAESMATSPGNDTGFHWPSNGANDSMTSSMLSHVEDMVAMGAPMPWSQDYVLGQAQSVLPVHMQPQNLDRNGAQIQPHNLSHQSPHQQSGLYNGTTVSSYSPHARPSTGAVLEAQDGSLVKIPSLDLDTAMRRFQADSDRVRVCNSKRTRTRSSHFRSDEDPTPSEGSPGELSPPSYLSTGSHHLYPVTGPSALRPGDSPVPLAQQGVEAQAYYHRLPNKLKIIKPLEGSLTLRQWQHLATPSLTRALFEDQPGVRIRGGQRLPSGDSDRETTPTDNDQGASGRPSRQDYLEDAGCSLTDGEDEDDYYWVRAKCADSTFGTFTYTTAKILHPTDDYLDRPHNTQTSTSMPHVTSSTTSSAAPIGPPSGTYRSSPSPATTPQQGTAPLQFPAPSTIASGNASIQRTTPQPRSATTTFSLNLNLANLLCERGIRSKTYDQLIQDIAYPSSNLGNPLRFPSLMRTNLAKAGDSSTAGLYSSMSQSASFASLSSQRDKEKPESISSDDEGTLSDTSENDASQEGTMQQIHNAFKQFSLGSLVSSVLPSHLLGSYDSPSKPKDSTTSAAPPVTVDGPLITRMTSTPALAQMRPTSMLGLNFLSSSSDTSSSPPTPPVTTQTATTHKYTPSHRSSAVKSNDRVSLTAALGPATRYTGSLSAAVVADDKGENALATAKSIINRHAAQDAQKSIIKSPIARRHQMAVSMAGVVHRYDPVVRSKDESSANDDSTGLEKEGQD